MQHSKMPRLENSSYKLPIRKSYYCAIIDNDIHFLIHYLVNCEWSSWTIDKCTKTCGAGNMTKIRTEKVAADHGGLECVGPSTLTESCNIRKCPGNAKLIES